jgi:aerobic carbon-monoxide dehydrogenase small subunit
MISLKVNGKLIAYGGPQFKRLIDVLREDAALTGTKEGCGEGECGACTVLIDGEPVNSCLVPVCQMEGKTIETVENLGTPDKLNPLQKSFLACGGAQCGICTPGMLMASEAHLRGGGKADRASLCRALSGNLCRCTGYEHILKSVEQAAKNYKASVYLNGKAKPAKAKILAKVKSGKAKLSLKAKTKAKKAVR